MSGWFLRNDSRGLLLVAAIASALRGAPPSHAPANLDFRQGEDGKAPASWTLPAPVKAAGYTVEIRHEGYPVLLPCAVIVPPPQGSRAIDGDLMQTVDAVPYRARSVRVRAWLRLGKLSHAGLRAAKEDSAQLWIRAEKAGHTPGILDSHGDRPVRSDEWTQSELVLPIGQDTESISFGVLARGNREIWIRGVSFDVPPDGAASGADEPAGVTHSGLSAPTPLNLSFSEGGAGETPPFWLLAPAARAASEAYHAETATKGCRSGPVCAVLRSPGAAAQTASGTLMQSFNADAWRGRTIRFQAWLKLQPAEPDQNARCWINSAQAAAADTAGATGRNPISPVSGGKTLYRDVTSGNWSRCYIVMTVDDDARSISFGVTLTGKGSVWIDDVSLDADPKGPATAPAAPDLPAVETETAPSLEEQSRIIADASRNALNYTRELPDFICAQMVQRFENPSGTGWRLKDVLAVQLGYAGGTEHHKLLSINNKASNASYTSVGGAIYQGEFGSLMAEIFRPHSADFAWKGHITVRNRAAVVFRYEMPLAKTQYHLIFHNGRGPASEINAAHHGYVYLDEETAQILRIIQVADIPVTFPLRSSSIVLDYDYSDIGGKKYLLPLKAEVQIASPDLQTRNELEFRDYRKFSADSSISFDQQ